LQNHRAFIFQDAGSDLASVMERRELHEIDNASKRASPRVCAAKDEAANSSRGRSCSARKLQLLITRERDCAPDLQQGKSVLIFSLVASWCNGSTRDSGSLCLGSNPSEAAKHQKGFTKERLR
jgi:hypothetical protein